MYGNGPGVANGRLGKLEDWYDSEVIMSFASDYAEPGYSKQDTGPIAFGNWNDKTEYVDRNRVVLDNRPGRIAAVLERCGYTLEWYDEWAECSHCHKAFRTEADSYSWIMYGWFDESDYLCGDCVQEHFVEEFLEACVKNEMTNTLLPAEILKENGFVLHNDYPYANGWHPGQDDDPNKIRAALEERGYDVVVDLINEGAHNSQFYVKFVVWVRPITSEEDE